MVCFDGIDSSFTPLVCELLIFLFYAQAESPEREVYRDPDVVRADDSVEGDELQHSMTTSKMLSIFRQMEEKAQRDDVPDGMFQIFILLLIE